MGHEELEQGVTKIVKLLSTETKTHKQKLMQQHKVAPPLPPPPPLLYFFRLLFPPPFPLFSS